MTKNSYTELIELLDQSLPRQIQEDAMNKILNLPDFNPELLMQPLGKAHWENAAKILQKMDYQKIIHLTPSLLEWMSDLNWPGADTVIDILKSFPKEQLLPYLEDAISLALKTHDIQWIDWMSTFTFDNTLSREDFSDKELFDLLKSREDDTWIR